MNFLHGIARAIHNSWHFLQGKKTVIGAGLIVSSAVISGGIPMIPVPVIPHVAVASLVMFKAGASMGGLGLANKVLKWAAKISALPQSAPVAAAAAAAPVEAIE